MQKTMQSKCAVFRTEKTLKEGMNDIRKPFEGMEDISVSDKSLLFNTDLVEDIAPVWMMLMCFSELSNLTHEFKGRHKILELQLYRKTVVIFLPHHRLPLLDNTFMELNEFPVRCSVNAELMDKGGRTLLRARYLPWSSHLSNSLARLPV